MKKFTVFIISIFLLITPIVLFLKTKSDSQVLGDVTGAPPYGESLDEIPDLDPMARFRNWKRPEGPPRVGLQVGHWKSEEQPEELAKLRDNTGSSGGGKWEWEVNYEIATITKSFLEKNGVSVDLIPATVPPEYWADVFVAIHADGSLDPDSNGFKIASPWRDFSGKANQLVELLEESYEQSTHLNKDDNITRNMRGYYAFSWWRYEHAVHPMTTSAIVETGFLTNKGDRKTIISNPQVSARGLYQGIINYLNANALLASK